MKELKAGDSLQQSILLDGALIPEAILKDPTLSAGARLLFVLLAEYQGKSVECFPLEEMLAVQLGVKVRQLQTYIKELEHYARRDPPEAVLLIEVKRVWVGKQSKTRNIYNLLRQPFLTVSRMAEEAHLAGGGNAQCSAHRSEGNAQDTAATAERPVIPSEEAGAAPDSMPPSDTQSFAHRSEGDTQDAAAGRPASPSDAGGAVLDGIPIPRDMYTESQLLRQQLLRQQQAQPPAPACDRSSYRPVVPGYCLIHASTHRCQKCGATVTPVHIMMGLIGGSFCERCCPACHPAG